MRAVDILKPFHIGFKIVELQEGLVTSPTNVEATFATTSSTIVTITAREDGGSNNIAALIVHTPQYQCRFNSLKNVWFAYDIELRRLRELSYKVNIIEGNLKRSLTCNVDEEDDSFNK